MDLVLDLDRARAGDGAAFDRLIGPLRRELHAHCYRMLGSAHDADDALQDALVRAWQGFAGFAGRGSLRAWLYTTATRSCLNLVQASRRRAMPVDLGPASERAVLDGAPPQDVAWLGPYPDAGLIAEEREAVELAFVAALQHLPGNQRAALLLFDVLGFTVAEIATMMQTSATSVNSALARARRVVAEKVPARSQQQTARDLGDARLREIVASFAAAFERGDADALVKLLTEDVTWSMPPLAQWYSGIDAVMEFAVAVPITLCPSFRTLPVSANGQPSVAFYVGASPAGPHEPWSITVLTLRGALVCDMVSFLDPAVFAPFGLPDRI
ncbi:MAG: sigma-70 family RNA polymerase sigma factor [Hamadaea sp.]|nr:sigma-70 family RNA polymerase sigma factor [Hamadaea sp.]